MQIVSEIAEIVASAIDCVLVLWFLTSHFGKKKTIEWWKYAVWFVILFIPSHFMGEMFNLQSIIVILIVTSFSMIYLQRNSIEKLIVSLILYIMLAFVNIMVIQVISVLSKSPMEVLISGNDILRILVLCISKVTVILTFVIVERGFSKKHYFKKEEYIFGAVLYITFFIVAVLTVKIVGTVEMTFREQMIFFILTMLLLVINSFMFWLIRKMNYQNRCELENEVLKVQLEQQESQIHNTELLYQNTRKMRHDMKHYFTTYLQLLRDGETEVVIQEMQSILETELEAENVFYMESRMVNAVINQKAALCKKNKISLEVQITGEFHWENESNIAILLSNLLDNAIEAEIQQENKREIRLKMFIYKEMINIIVENYILKSVLGENPELKTTKKEKRGHGIGIESVKELVRREEGDLEIFEENNYFISHILIPCKAEKICV